MIPIDGLSGPLCILEVEPSLQACTCYNKENKASRQAKQITEKAHKGANKQKKAHKGVNKHVIKQTCSQKDKCRFGFGVRSSIILEYGQPVCHQAKFLNGTRDFVYKDGSEPARNPRQELGLMTQISTQRHMYEDINKDATMQVNVKAKKMAQNKHSKHKGSKACYHTKRRGKHVIRHIEGVTCEILTCNAKKRRER